MNRSLHLFDSFMPLKVVLYFVMTRTFLSHHQCLCCLLFIIHVIQNMYFAVILESLLETSYYSCHLIYYNTNLVVIFVGKPV